MDGRTAVAAALGVAVFVTSACSQPDPAGTVDASQAAVETSGPAEPGAPESRIERPSLRQIFRDGRYELRPVPRAEKREFVETMRANPDSDAQLRTLHAMDVFESGRRILRATAIVFRRSATRDPGLWEAFVAAAAPDEGPPPKWSTVAGTEAAYLEPPTDVHVLLVWYEPDLVIGLTAPHRTSRSQMEDVARYLLSRRRR